MVPSDSLDANLPFVEATTALLVSETILGGFEWILDDVFGTGMDVLAELLGTPMLEYPYMQRAYLAAVCIAVIGPLVGTFLVHREMAMIGDTLAHTAFAGVAVGLFLNSALSLTLSPLLTAFWLRSSRRCSSSCSSNTRARTATPHWRSS